MSSSKSYDLRANNNNKRAASPVASQKPTKIPKETKSSLSISLPLSLSKKDPSSFARTKPEKTKVIIPQPGNFKAALAIPVPAGGIRIGGFNKDQGNEEPIRTVPVKPVIFPALAPSQVKGARTVDSSENESIEEDSDKSDEIEDDEREDDDANGQWQDVKRKRGSATLPVLSSVHQPRSSDVASSLPGGLPYSQWGKGPYSRRTSPSPVPPSVTAGQPSVSPGSASPASPGPEPATVLPKVNAADEDQQALYKRFSANMRDSNGKVLLTWPEIQWMERFFKATKIEEARKAQEKDEEAMEAAVRLIENQLQAEREAAARLIEQQQAEADAMRQDGKCESDITAAAPKALSTTTDEDGDLRPFDCTRDKLAENMEKSAVARRFAAPGRVDAIMGKGLVVNVEKIRRVDLSQPLTHREFDAYFTTAAAVPSATPVCSPAQLQVLTKLPGVVDPKLFNAFLGINVCGSWGEDPDTPVIGLSRLASPGVPLETFAGLRQAVDNFVALCAVVFGEEVREPFRAPMDDQINRGEQSDRVAKKPIILAYIIDSRIQRFWSTLRYEYHNAQGELVVLKNLGWVPIWKELFADIIINAEAVDFFEKRYEKYYKPGSPASSTVPRSSDTSSRLERSDPGPAAQSRRQEREDDRGRQSDRRDSFADRRSDRRNTGADRQDAGSDRRDKGSDRQSDRRDSFSDRRYDPSEKRPEPRKKICLSRLAVTAGLKGVTDCERRDCKFNHSFRDMSRVDILRDVEINYHRSFSANPIKKELMAAVEDKKIGRA